MSGRILELMDQVSHVWEYLSQAKSFITCILAQNPKEQTANSLQGDIEYIKRTFRIYQAKDAK